MKRCHDGSIELIPTSTTAADPHDRLPYGRQYVLADEVAVCCAVCHAVLATGPRTEVCADL